MVSSLRIIEEIFRTYPNFQTSPPFPPKKINQNLNQCFFFAWELTTNISKMQSFFHKIFGEDSFPQKSDFPKKVSTCTRCCRGRKQLFEAKKGAGARSVGPVSFPIPFQRQTTRVISYMIGNNIWSIYYNYNSDMSESAKFFWPINAVIRKTIQSINHSSGCFHTSTTKTDALPGKMCQFTWCNIGCNWVKPSCVMRA